MRGKLKRIVVLVSSIVLLYLFSKFFIYGDYKNTTNIAGFGIEPLSQGFTNVELGENDSNKTIDFKNYPSPSSFKIVRGDMGKIIVSGECRDKYLTFLIYKIDTDYRYNPQSAVVNKAFPCSKNLVFNETVELGGNFGNSDYYLITADQGTKGTWYNPR